MVSKSGWHVQVQSTPPRIAEIAGCPKHNTASRPPCVGKAPAAGTARALRSPTRRRLGRGGGGVGWGFGGVLGFGWRFNNN